MEKVKALEIARIHIAEMNEQNTIESVKWIVTEPVDKAAYWLFEYEFEQVKNKESPVTLGGASGYTVDKKDGTVRVLSWPEYQDINDAS